MGLLSKSAATTDTVVVAASCPPSPVGLDFQDDNDDDVVIVDGARRAAETPLGVLPIAPLPLIRFSVSSLPQRMVDDAYSFPEFCLLNCGESLSYDRNSKRPLKAVSDHRIQCKRHFDHMQNCQAVCIFTIKCAKEKDVAGKDLLHCPFCNQGLSSNPKGYVKHLSRHKPISSDGNCFIPQSNSVQILKVF